MARAALPNSPLVEVVYELRFHGELSLLGSWGELQRELRSDYPKLFVPAAAVGAPPLLQPLRLVSQDDQHYVLLALNSFAFGTRAYATFPDFEARFSKAFDAFRRHCSASAYTRFGLRYINSLPPVFDAPREPDQLHPCLRLRVTGWDGLPSASEEQPQLVFSGVTDGLQLRLALLRPDAAMLPIALPQGVLPGVQLDLDCYMAGELKEDGALDVLRRAHASIDAAFFKLVTPEYERYLHGGAQ